MSCKISRSCVHRNQPWYQRRKHVHGGVFGNHTNKALSRVIDDTAALFSQRRTDKHTSEGDTLDSKRVSSSAGRARVEAKNSSACTRAISLLWEQWHAATMPFCETTSITCALSRCPACPPRCTAQ
eukprot:m.1236735 g.1236735  ORF g.1236735 m.1236735 type:complete len:126 (-) comp24667_c1_seq13:5114-5491(-)